MNIGIYPSIWSTLKVRLTNINFYAGTPPLGVGENFTHWFNVRCRRAGIAGVVGTADAILNNENVENNELNNQLTKLIICGAENVTPADYVSRITVVGNHTNGTGFYYHLMINTTNQGPGIPSFDSITEVGLYGDYVRDGYPPVFTNDAVIVPPLNSGQSDIVYRNLSCMPSEVTVVAVADKTDRAFESDENNNRNITNLSACPSNHAPDIVISAFTIPLVMTVGKTYRAVINTTNIGNEIAQMQPTDFELGGRMPKYIYSGIQTPHGWVVPDDLGLDVPLYPSQTRTASLDFVWCRQAGNFNVRAAADILGVVQELDESNNARSIAVTCRPSPVVSANATAISSLPYPADTKKERSAGVLNSMGLGFLDDFFKWLLGG